MFEVKTGEVVGTSSRGVSGFADGSADLVLSDGREIRVEFVLLVDVPHDFPGASTRSVRSNRSKLGCEFLSDCVGFVERFVIEEYWLIWRGIDVLVADLPHDAPEFLCICDVVTAADVFDPGFP